ncbi:MAG: lactate racemase domain-containing protein, partial [Spirochaetaceae bacterium]|nr:lactate racemase domain-containing protein [Spirochaetaceae bacterium]
MSSLMQHLCDEMTLPRMIRVKQRFDGQKIDAGHIPALVAAELSRPEIAGKISAGKTVAVTCGSRGVVNVAVITRAIVDFVKSRGGKPFVVPAMGSHAGATAEGQKELIGRYGVTEEFLGCPIKSSMETVEIGVSDAGPHVRLDKNAATADAIIVAGRVKAHTDFRGPYESGLMKMMAIGLGKREGADICHQLGFGHMAHRVHLFGRAIVKHA